MCSLTSAPDPPLLCLVECLPAIQEPSKTEFARTLEENTLIGPEAPDPGVHSFQHLGGACYTSEDEVKQKPLGEATEGPSMASLSQQ